MKTILIVDEAESVRFYHRLLLTRAGFRVLEASSVNNALPTVSNEAVDLIMVEPLSSRESGIEVLTQLQQSTDPTRVPFLIVTSDTPDWQPERQRSHGIVTKPSLPEALLEGVHRLLH